ncbi:MAG: hypothetical protein HFI82_10615 [Eubacterium sp.]|nr:hypothetical protein [Eubacterium sp.]
MADELSEPIMGGIMLEKEIAALSHFIKPIIKTQYFGEIPEGIATPSAYFPVPEMLGKEHSLNSFKNSFTLYIKVFDKNSIDSYSAASEIINKIQSAKKKIPLYDSEGNLTDKVFHVKRVLLKKIDVGVTQLTVEWDAHASYQYAESIKSTDLHFGGMPTSIEKEGNDG